MSEISHVILCRVIDTDTGPHRPYRPRSIRSVDELEKLLREYVTRHPRILEVHLQKGLMLWVGIGGDLAAITAYPIPNAPYDVRPHWTAQARRPYTTRTREFVNQSVPYEFEANALMPPEEVIEIILYFVRHCDLPDSHVWGDPGLNQYQWGEDGTRQKWEKDHLSRQAKDDIPF